ncbi:extracellular solute-binding protein [Bacillus sp. FJAT-45037]|uniref:extracellular solute-binding protein n=1 Tax=Bacillus sp. FJAT-45037 TaxID=2011007 RepID=UPI000C2354C5|nr:extracellular solute-binding protein [Bacillus sp. FJAT-45037]
MKLRSFLLFLVMSLTIAALVACGPDREEEATPAPAEGEDGEATTEVEKPDTLTMWVNDEDAQLDAYDEITARFTEEYGIDVDITPFSMLEQTDALSLDAASGGGPDLFFQPNDRMGDIYLQGLAAELELTEEQLAGYPEGALQALSYEGAQLGIPAVIETYGLMYNTDLVPEAPETIEELEQIAADLTDASADEYGFLMEGTNFYFLYPFLEATGGYVFNQDADGAYDNTDLGLANEGAVAGAERIQNWFEEGYLPQGITGDVMNGLFEAGKVGAVVTGPWNIPNYSQALGDSLAVAPLPQIDGENLASFSGVKGWLVNEYSENIEWATELALFITNAESVTTYFEVAGELPARSDVEIDDELRAGLVEQAEYAVPMPNIPAMSQVWDPMADAFEFISQGQDAQEVLEEAVEQIKEQIQLTEGAN